MPVLASAVLPVLLLQAGGPAGGPPGLRAARVASAVRVDGALDEEAWKATPVASGFRQREPREGEPAREATEVRVVYDRDTLWWRSPSIPSTTTGTRSSSPRTPTAPSSTRW